MTGIRDAPTGAGRAVTVVTEDPRLPYPYGGGSFSDLDTADRQRLEEALRALSGYRFEILDDHADLPAALARRQPGFVFNLCDTGLRNRAALEAHVPALLETLEIPYSGAGPEGLAICRDKALTRDAASQLGIAVPAELYIGHDPPDPDLHRVRYPAILKPNLDDGSRTITAASVVDSPRAAAARLRDLRAELPGRPWLLQEFLPGAEYCVGLVGNRATGFQLLPIQEVDYDRLEPGLPPILAFGFKTDPQSRYWRQVRYRPAALDSPAADQLAGYSRRLFARLGCRDYARFDFRADATGRVRLLEVNPNPAWVFEGSLHAMAAMAGYDYPAFLELLLEAALDRLGLADGPRRQWRPEPPG